MNSLGWVVEEIAACEVRLRGAQLASDVRELDGLIGDELIFVDVAGRIATKAMDLESHRSGGLKLAHSELKEQEIRPLSESVAVAIVRVSLVGSYEGNEFAGDFRYTRVWQKSAEGWRIVVGHMSVLAP